MPSAAPLFRHVTAHRLPGLTCTASVFLNHSLLDHPFHPADFLTATLDKGGLTGMLALNGIFELVRLYTV